MSRTCQFNKELERSELWSKLPNSSKVMIDTLSPKPTSLQEEIVNSPVSKISQNSFTMSLDEAVTTEFRMLKICLDNTPSKRIIKQRLIWIDSWKILADYVNRELYQEVDIHRQEMTLKMIGTDVTLVGIELEIEIHRSLPLHQLLEAILKQQWHR